LDLKNLNNFFVDLLSRSRWRTNCSNPKYQRTQALEYLRYETRVAAGAIRIRKVKSNLVEVTGLFVMFVRNGLNPADLEPLK
jgi:hypothetical protein